MLRFRVVGLLGLDALRVVSRSAEKAACATLRALREERGKGHRNASYGRESVLYVIPLTAARRR